VDVEQKKRPYREIGATVPEVLEHKSASDVLRAVINSAKGETISIGEIIEAFGERAFGFVLILFSLPNCVPAPPGIAGIVGTPVLIFGVQLMLGHKHPWLPGFIRRRTISLAKFKRLIDMAEPKLRWLESWCKPRLTQLFGVLGDRMIGLFAFLVALSVLVPFPGTNFPPSIALVVVSVAVMEEDGYLLILGYLIGPRLHGHGAGSFLPPDPRRLRQRNVLARAVKRLCLRRNSVL
jgi:hypothetical protein